MNNSDVDVEVIRAVLKNKILHDTDFIGYEKERAQIFDLLERTIKNGESNSALLIGPRGAGKTVLINAVVKDLRKSKSFERDGVLVNLHGLIHTDDRLALKSITSQMNLDNAVDGKVFGSFADNLAFLLACLRSGQRHTSKSVLFILDEFDLFCSHHNQTLLYNLFDVSQSAQAPICVLGITCRLDVIELLEKRVKSRFSHRQVFLFPGHDEKSDISNLDYTVNRIEYFLKLPDIRNTNDMVQTEWNTNLRSLLSNKKFRDIIQRLIDIDLNERTLKNMLVRVLSHLSEKKCKLTADDFQKCVHLIERDDILHVLQDFTVLELCIVIAMKHHVEIYDNQPMNFEMIFTRYIKFANANSNIQTVQRPVIMKAFEHIETLELISMVASGGSKTQKEYQFFKLLVTSQQISEAVNKLVGLPTEVVQWANSSLA